MLVLYPGTDAYNIVGIIKSHYDIDCYVNIGIMVIANFAIMIMLIKRRKLHEKKCYT